MPTLPPSRLPSARLPRAAASVARLLGPAGHCYGYAMAVRSELYARGGLYSFTPPLPTVSVGNLSMGGTGKTPLTIWLARWATERGLKPVVLTRGYKARPPRLPFPVLPDSPPAQAGDEPLLLAAADPRVTVLVDPRRVRAARWALDPTHGLNPDLFLLDDGFQHLALGRHLDLVLLTPQDLTSGWQRIFPAGRWREGREALARASAFLIKTIPGAEGEDQALAEATARLAPLAKPIYAMCLEPAGVTPLLASEAAPAFGDGPYLLACGVAHPDQVAASASQLLGRPPAKVAGLDDHHSYTPGDLLALEQSAARHGCAAIVVTPKDAVKLRPLLAQRHRGGPQPGPAYWVLEPEPRFTALAADRPFEDWWQSAYIRTVQEVRHGQAS